MSNEKKLSEGAGATTGKMISWSFGDIIGYYLGSSYVIFIFFFYEVEVGLSVVLVGLAFIIFAIWNAINDPLVAYFTDKPFKWTRKWGMRFPWIMIGVFPMLLCYFLIFTPPTTSDHLIIFLYMVITLCLFDLFFSLYGVHFYGSFTMQFRSDEERRKVSVFTNIIPGLGVFAVSIIPPLFIKFGDIASYALAMLFIVLILAICAIIVVPGIRESDELKEIYIRGYESTEKLSFYKTARIAFKHRSFVALIISILFGEIAFTLLLASELYYFKDVLGLPYSYTIFSLLASHIGFIISIPFWFLVAKKIGHAQTYTLGLLIAAITPLLLLWIMTIEGYVIFSFINGFGFGAFFFMMYIIFADINDEIALTVGKRLEATLAGIRTVTFRIAIVFQAIIMVLVHIATGYNPNRSTQTPLAIWGIRVHMALIPSIFTFIAFLITFIWYDLKDEKKEKIFALLKEKGLK
jgi:GPH family glycoside/pentoside/hexuronide:cation symporter